MIEMQNFLRELNMKGPSNITCTLKYFEILTKGVGPFSDFLGLPLPLFPEGNVLAETTCQ